ncbi:MAG: hypothetical protein QOJ23_4803 [Actinomycetota bacterium]|nr:hypothetical protein [Actinomycetota bacterium]MDQ1500633.1 hypothetical protein [Actinomycetota bacterium]MDQ1565660.1 hypothetical protein [Actinomycetota bacterium]
MTETRTPGAEPPWPSGVLEQLARVIGDTSDGLTGSQIESLLDSCRMPDPGPITKWRRLVGAFQDRQATDGSPKRLVTFITKVMEPVRYRNDPGAFTTRQDALNEILVHVGLRINDAGQIARGPKASTLSEAAQHANSLRLELRRRGTHPEVLRYCTQEVLERNWFHAALEATKSISDRLRAMTGATSDGAALIDTTLALGSSGARVAINAGVGPTDRSEQTGLANLCKGLIGMFRNPTAHDPRITRPVTSDELLEILTTISMVHRRLDHASF